MSFESGRSLARAWFRVAAPICVWHIHWVFESRHGVLHLVSLALLSTLACGGVDPELGDVQPYEVEISPEAASSSAEATAGGLPECGGGAEKLPELTTLLLMEAAGFVTAGGDFSEEPVEGRGVVRSMDGRSMTIESEGCCTFALERSSGVPAFAQVGDELSFSLRYVPYFNPEWTLMLREPGGRLLYFRHNERFDSERHELMGLPFDIDLEASCAVTTACYTTTERLLVTLTSDTDRVTLGGRQRGALQIDGEDYQVLDHLSAHLSGFTDCDDPSPPGDHLTLEVIPAHIRL